MAYDRSSSCDRDRPRVPRGRAPGLLASRSSLERRCTIGTESAQTRHTIPTTVRLPLGGRGLGTGRKGATIATIGRPGGPADATRAARLFHGGISRRTVPPRASGGRHAPRRGR